MEENSFITALFEGASEAIKSQAITTNAAYKKWNGKKSLLIEAKEIASIAEKQESAAYLEFRREERIYGELLLKDKPKDQP
jgi:hypothetical protein